MTDTSDRAIAIQAQAETARKAVKAHNAPLQCMVITIVTLIFFYHVGISTAAFVLMDQYENDPCLVPMNIGLSYSSWLLGLGILHGIAAIETIFTAYAMTKFDNPNVCGLQCFILAFVWIWWVMGIVFFNRMTCSGPLYTFALTYIIMQIFSFVGVCQWLCHRTSQ